MEVLSQSLVTDRASMRRCSDSRADNGPLIASQAGHSNTGRRRDYSLVTDDSSTHEGESRKVAVSATNTIERNIPIPAEIIFSERENCNIVNNNTTGQVTSCSGTSYGESHRIIVSTSETTGRNTPIPSPHGHRRGDRNTVKSARKITPRRTTLLSKTKYHYVKMTGERSEQESAAALLVEEIYPPLAAVNSKLSRSAESIAMDSESDGYCSSTRSSFSLGPSGGIYGKRLSIVSGLSHSDYDTSGSLTSLDGYETDDRFSVCSGGVKDDNHSCGRGLPSSSNNFSQFSQPDGQTSRPVSSVLGDSEFEELDFSSEVEDGRTSPAGGQRRHEEGTTNLPKRERPAILDQGMTATMAWLRAELMEIRKMDQSLIGQFMNIQGKIRTLKTQQQQRHKQSVAGESSSELLGNHRFSWELDSLYEEEEYYDYDSEDDSDDQDGGACGYS